MAHDGEAGSALTPNLNPFAPPSADSDPAVNDVAASAGDVAAMELRLDVDAFVGKRSAYYWRHWKGALLGQGPVTGVNFSAFIFNFSWLIYRKMYLECVILFVGVGAANVALELAIGESATLDRVVSLTMAAALGGTANRLYLRKARRAMAEARTSHVDTAPRRRQLARKGGTSWVAVIVTVVSLAIAGVTAARWIAQSGG